MTCLVAALVVPLSGLQLVSVKDEIALGRRAQQQIKKEVSQLTDPAVTSYVQTLGRRLAARATGASYPYTFSVANYREVNAFALPGGPVWVHRGAIAAAQNEAQLAGVLAHEIAHIALRHSADQVTKSLVANGFLGLLGAMLGNDGSARAAQTAAQIMAGGYMLKFSRDDEREADRVGAGIVREAGWDPRETIRFMNLLARQQGKDQGAVMAYLSSHPAPAERANLLQAELQHAGSGRKDSAAFRRVRIRLTQLPPARAMPTGRH